MTQLYLIFKELQDLQQSMPPAEANNDLLNTLKVGFLKPIILFQKSRDVACNYYKSKYFECALAFTGFQLLGGWIIRAFTFKGTQSFQFGNKCYEIIYTYNLRV